MSLASAMTVGREFVLHASPEGSINGKYPIVGVRDDIGCVVLQEFGSDPGLRPNREIIEYYCCQKPIQGYPLFASASIASVLPRYTPEARLVGSFEGVSATNRGENLGTFGELQQLVDYMREKGIKGSPLLISSAYNMGNILRQAGVLGIDPITLAGYPGSFDPRSKQLWTKHRLAWVLTSRLRVAVLRAKGH